MSTEYTFEEKLDRVLQMVKETLLEKNRKYGDSALKPIRVFSKEGKEVGIRVRIDDKISRMMNQQTDEDEDVEFDLLGYLVILQIAKYYR